MAGSQYRVFTERETDNVYLEFLNLFVKEYGRLRRLILIFVVTVAASVMEGFSIGLLVPLLETLKSPGQQGGHWITHQVANLYDGLNIPFELWSMLLGFAAINVAVAGLKYLRMVLATRASEQFGVWLRSKFMWNLLHMDISYFHQQRLGILTDTLSTQTDRATGALSALTEIVVNTTMTLVYLVAALVIAPALTGIALGMVLAITISMQYFVARAKTIGSTLLLRQNELQVEMAETLTGIRLIKSLLLERTRWLDFNAKAEHVGSLGIRQTLNQAQLVILQELALIGLVAGMVLLGVSILSLDIALVAALLFVLYRMAPRLSNINRGRQSLAALVAAVQALRAAIVSTANPLLVTGHEPFVNLKEGIELKSVVFSYNGSGKVLRDTSFTIQRGKMTAIVGASGAGKSTLVDLILRFYDPDEGSIQVDGVDLRELDLPAWRNAIGVVSQDVFLFNDTVANNIGLGAQGASQASIVDAAKQAYAHDFVQGLPQAYDSLVGDRGWNLSGGQRQRLALARAILKRPEILILDEATSSLDSESEELIQRYIGQIRGACTMVVVAHRLSTIQTADNIVVLQDGQVVEQGHWNSLLAAEGVFATYHRFQYRE